jgi:hypothetical protein
MEITINQFACLLRKAYPGKIQTDLAIEMSKFGRWMCANDM